MTDRTRRTYAALRTIVQEHGGAADALTGLTELAGLLSHRGLSASAAVKWLMTGHSRLETRRPLDVWLDGHADHVIDTARAETGGSA